MQDRNGTRPFYLVRKEDGGEYGSPCVRGFRDYIAERAAGIEARREQITKIFHKKLAALEAEATLIEGYKRSAQRLEDMEVTP
jgi:hypothetical protein